MFYTKPNLPSSPHITNYQRITKYCSDTTQFLLHNSTYFYRTQRKTLKMRFFISFLSFAFANQKVLLMESYIQYTPNQINGRLFDIRKTGGDSGVFAYKKPPSIIWGSIFNLSMIQQTYEYQHQYLLFVVFWLPGEYIRISYASLCPGFPLVVLLVYPAALLCVDLRLFSLG